MLNDRYRLAAYRQYGGQWPATSQLRATVMNSIEAWVNKTGKKAVLGGHSEGSIESYAFLMQTSQAWRDKYLQALVARRRRSRRKEEEEVVVVVEEEEEEEGEEEDDDKEEEEETR